MSAKISPSSSVGWGRSVWRLFFFDIFGWNIHIFYFSSSSSSSSSSYSNKHKILCSYIFYNMFIFRSMLQDYLSVTWIVFWISMFVAYFLLRHHPKWIDLRHLQIAIHSQRVCSLYDSLSFFLLGNRIMYHLSMWINNLNKVWLQFFSFINWTCFGMLITRGFFH